MVLAHNILNGQRTKDIQITQDVTFENMFLSSATLKGLKDSGFIKPSPIQLHGIPMGKCGFDLILEAKSGTGKTAVFTVIALEKLNLTNGLQVIILAPTREIAAQICDVLRQIGRRYKGLCVEVVMGGLPIQDDINKFMQNNVHIVVGSPGRLRHLIQENYMDTSSVSLFILDEADKLMDKSFIADIKCIHSVLPKQKQVIMSSATYPEASKEFINFFLHGAQHICPDSNCILLGVSQKVTYVKYNSSIVKLIENKFKELLRILTKKQFKQCLIFCNYQARVGDLYKMLTKEKWPAEQLCGKQEQLDRLDALRTFQEYKCRVLISTDLVARGIDAMNVDLVINFEPPYDWETYLHRIGRAGRFGSYGMAVTILSEGEEQKKFITLLKMFDASIHLTPLWSEDGAHNNIDETQKNGITLNHSENNDSEDLLEVFVDGMCENQEIIEEEKYVNSFDDFITSFKETKNNDVKSTDCISLFKNNHVSVNDLSCSYKKFAIPEIPRENINRTLQYIKEKAADNLLEQKPNNLNVSNESNKEKLGQINSTSSHDSGINSVPNDVNDNKIVISLPGCSKATNILDNNAFDSSTLEEAEMLKLGLPLNFSSKSREQINSKLKQNNSQYKTLHSHKKRLISNSQQYSVPNECQNQDKGQKVNSSNRNKYDHISEDRRTRKSSNTRECSSSYINWYTQLKLRTQQIEQAIYIEELSKL